ncbi:MAG: hypothetical protein U1F47_12870 [Hyphomicrobiales bacterium]|jgi:hypothetical protein
MRIAILTAAALAAFASSAMAYENFIPMGHAYAPGQNALPPLNSEQDKLNAQVDIEESATWVRDRNAILFSSRLKQISSDQKQRAPSGDFIDY